MKLELKHIVGYLPYQLKGQYINEDGDVEMIHVLGFHDNGILSYENNSRPSRRWIDWSVCRTLQKRSSYFFIENFKPILRPMGDIVNPCLKDGKIPVEEIAKIHIGYDEAIEDSDFKAEYSFSRQMRIDITWLNPISKERLYSDDLFIQTDRTHLNRYWVNEWLYQHHFDTHGLIEQGLAIDINTL